MAGKFSCDACGKQYSWKPELGGKRVKCKCGTPISIPASDPAGDDIGDLGDLAALSDGAPTTPGAVAGGPTCPGCGSGVDPSAVICVNCGQNLKTGKKLKTSKVAAAAAGGGIADTYAPGYRSYGAVAQDEGMSPKQKKLIIASSIAGLVAVVAIFIVFVLPDAKRKNEQAKAIDARPAKLERALTAMDENDGLVGAMKNGALIGGPAGAAAGTAAAAGGAAAPTTPPGAEFNERHEALLSGEAPKVGKKFLLNPKARFMAQTREKTEQIITELYKQGCSSVVVIGLHAEAYTNEERATGCVATLPPPENKDARTKIFAFYHTLENTIEPLEMERQHDKGQKYIAIEFKDPRADGPRGR
jgi:hypothetical protein